MSKIYMVTKYCCGHDEVDSLWSNRVAAESRVVDLLESGEPDYQVDEWELDGEEGNYA
jgi:hypothetical protein